MSPHNYAAQGEQTQCTERVYEHADNTKKIIIEDPAIVTLPEPAIATYKVCKYIFQLPYIKGFIPEPKTREEQEKNRQLKDAVFRQRDLDQVLEEGYYPTCSDIGLLFRGLMIAQGHPTAYVETFHEDYLLDKAFHGHVFARVIEGNKSVIVNPQRDPIITHDENDIFPYIIFKEGLDSWDIGIHGYDDMHRLKEENKDMLLKKYEKNLTNQFQNKIRAIRKKQLQGTRT